MHSSTESLYHPAEAHAQASAKSQYTNFTCKFSIRTFQQQTLNKKQEHSHKTSYFVLQTPGRVPMTCEKQIAVEDAAFNLASLEGQVYVQQWLEIKHC